MRALFVDDEPAVLRMLRVGLRALTPEWELIFAERGDAALALMQETPVDVLVTDMRMASVNGAEVINEAQRRFPQTVRLVLSGYADEELVMRCVAATHQYLAKPPNLENLQATLRRIARLGARLPRVDVRSAVTRANRLPSAPAAQAHLIEVLESPSCSISQIGQVVDSDPCLAAQVLKLVNSAFFGFTREVGNAAEGVQLLGVGAMRALALTFQWFTPCPGAVWKVCDLERVWRHSQQTATLARRVAQAQGADSRTAALSFTAGLLHDLGHLLLAENWPNELAQSQALVRGLPGDQTETELRIWQTTHADVGAYLLGLWGLPMPLVEAVGFHHAPSLSADQFFTPLTAVHIANALAHLDPPRDLEMLANSLDLEYLRRLKLVERLPHWLTLTTPAGL
jgi:HD-like signal output (HDOD) protein